MNHQYEITLHDSKGHESRVINGDSATLEDIVKTLTQTIETANAYGYCRVTLDIEVTHDAKTS